MADQNHVCPAVRGCSLYALPARPPVLRPHHRRRTGAHRLDHVRRRRAAVDSAVHGIHQRFHRPGSSTRLCLPSDAHRPKARPNRLRRRVRHRFRIVEPPDLRCGRDDRGRHAVDPSLPGRAGLVAPPDCGRTSRSRSVAVVPGRNRIAVVRWLPVRCQLRRTAREFLYRIAAARIRRPGVRRAVAQEPPGHRHRGSGADHRFSRRARSSW